MIGGLLPLALVVAISPTTITVVILILLSGRKSLASIVFAVGYTVGIVVGTTLLLVLGGAAGLSTGLDPGAVAWLELVVGILLLLYGLQRWTKRPKAGEAFPVPKWMTVMEDLTVFKAALVSLVLSALRPKNVLMFAGAAVTIASAHVSVADDIVSIAVFTVVSASTVVGLVIVALVRREKINPKLKELRDWLQANNVAMMSVVLLLVGVVEIGKSFGGFF